MTWKCKKHDRPEIACVICRWAENINDGFIRIDEDLKLMEWIEKPEKEVLK